MMERRRNVKATTLQRRHDVVCLLGKSIYELLLPPGIKGLKILYNKCTSLLMFTK